MKLRYIYSFVLLLFTLFIVFSCSKDSKVEPLIPKGRTLLVYIAGDGKIGTPSNLSGEVKITQEALMEGWNAKTMGSLVIFVDRNNSSPVLIKLENHKNKTVADTLRTYTNENSASPELLRQVIADIQIIAPGESYGMVLFSHASGWLPAGSFINPLNWEPSLDKRAMMTPRSIFEDNGSEMEFDDFVAAIPDGMFDFIASEMCFMSSVETAYALRNKTDYLLAAAPEVLSPGFRPIYKTSLGMLFKPKADLEGFGQAFFDYFTNDALNNFAAISLVRTSEIEALADLTREIAVPLLDQDQIDQIQHYDGNNRPDSWPHLFFDFRDYIAQVATPAEMHQLDDLLDKAVIFKRSTPKLLNINIPKHSGLSVYIPQERVPRLNEAYMETEWYKAITK